MYIESIIEEARDLLGDTKAPYLWSEKEMLRYYKNVINEFCRETFIYTDETTEGVCYVYLLPGVASYTLSPYVLAINSAYLSTNKSPVWPISHKILNEVSYDWRSTTGTPYRFVPNIEQQEIRVYPYYLLTQDAYFIGASNVTFAVTANTITVAAGGFTAAGFAALDHFVISGTTLNNGDYTIHSVSDTVITTHEALATESLTSADMRTIVDTMILNVARLPDMSLLTVDTWDTTSPPIQERWHSKLVPGIMAQAYNKRDSETYDPKDQEKCQSEWMSVIQDAKRDVILLSDDGERFNPNEGAL
jgi:hypothetical protein